MLCLVNEQPNITTDISSWNEIFLFVPYNDYFLPRINISKFS